MFDPALSPDQRGEPLAELRCPFGGSGYARRFLRLSGR
jgi:hypothetical protein